MHCKFFRLGPFQCFPSVAGIRLVCLLLLLALPTSGTAAELTVYAELEEAGNFPNNGDEPVPIGPGHKLLLAVLAEAGYKADVRVVPWPRVVHSLESRKNVLAFSMTRTPQREDRYHWIGLIRPVNFKLWSLPERADEMPDTLEAARDLRISAIRGDVVENYLLSKGFTNLVYLSESSNTLTMLRRDRIDLMPYIESGMADYLARKNASPDALVPVIDLEEISSGHYIVMNKQSDPALVQLLQESYRKVVERGELDSIINPAND